VERRGGEGRKKGRQQVFFCPLAEEKKLDAHTIQATALPHVCKRPVGALEGAD
jgi:hypothetical protein